MAFPELPTRPPLPQRVNPDSWLNAIHGRRCRRRIDANGAIKLDNRAYYVQRKLRGHYVPVVIDARQRDLITELDKRPIKRIPIKGLYHEELDFETYFEAIQEEARVHWRRIMRQRQVVSM